MKSTIFRTSKGENVSNLLAKIEPTSTITDEEALAFFDSRSNTNGFVHHTKWYGNDFYNAKIYPNEDNMNKVPDEATCAQLAIKNGMHRYSYYNGVCTMNDRSISINNTHLVPTKLLTKKNGNTRPITATTKTHIYPYNLIHKYPMNKGLRKYCRPALSLSFRKLNSSYFGPCVKVRAKSDTSGINMKDFRFTPLGLLDIKAIKEWNPTNERLFIHTWYDQGHRNHMVMPFQDNQPELVIDGNEVYAKFNGKSGFINTEFEPNSHYLSARPQDEFTVIAYSDKDDIQSGTFCKWGVDRKKNNRMKIMYGEPTFYPDGHTKSVEEGNKLIISVDDDNEVSYRSTNVAPKTSSWNSNNGVENGFQKMVISRYKNQDQQFVLHPSSIVRNKDFNYNYSHSDLHSNVFMGKSNMKHIDMGGKYASNNEKLYSSNNSGFIPNQLFSLGCDVEERSLNIKNGYKGKIKEFMLVADAGFVRYRLIKRILDSIDLTYGINYTSELENKGIKCNRTCQERSIISTTEDISKDKCKQECVNDSDCYIASYDKQANICKQFHKDKYPLSSNVQSLTYPSMNEDVIIKHPIIAVHEDDRNWRDYDLEYMPEGIPRKYIGV